MSARIRHSSLQLRRYDWIFCECINTQLSRALHIKRAVAKHDGLVTGTRRVAFDQAAAARTSDYGAEINRPMSTKPLVRRLEAVLSSIPSAKQTHQKKLTEPPARRRVRELRITKVPTGSTAKGVTIYRIGTDVQTLPKTVVRRKVSWGVDTNKGTTAKTTSAKITTKQSNSSKLMAAGQFSSEIGTQYTISKLPERAAGLVRKQWQTIPPLKSPTTTRASAGNHLRQSQELDVQRRISAEPKPVDKQSRNIRFIEVHAEPAPPLRPLIQYSGPRSLLSKPGSKPRL